MSPQVDETEPIGKTRCQEPRRGLREEHLPSVRKGANARRPTSYGPADIAALLNLAGVQSHAEANPNVVRPWLGLHLADELRGCPGGSTGAGEDRNRGIPFAHRLDQPAAVRLDRLGNDGVVAHQDGPHLPRVPLPKIR